MTPRYTTLVAALVAVVVVIAGAAVFAQQIPPGPPSSSRPGVPLPGGQPNARPAPVAEGTARIAGRVTSTDGKPLRGARVTAFSGALRRSWSARTDASGQYEIRTLPKSTLTVMAQKSGYVALGYGAKTATGASRPVPIVEGQAVESIDFSLPRACVITGQVLDELGLPAANASVEPLITASIGGRRRSIPASFGIVTDDRGMFRVYGLQPGRYLIASSKTLASGNVKMLDSSAYARTFYPGVTRQSEAQPVACAAGDETSGIVFPLARVRTATVSGHLVDRAGRPVSKGSVALMQTDDINIAGNLRATVQPDGSFTASAVPPGEYTLMAILPPSSPGASIETASMALRVGGQDVTGVTLQFVSGATARGRLVAAEDTPFDFKLNTLRIMPAIDPDNLLGSSLSMGPFKDDGTFELKGLNGLKRFNLIGLPDEWALHAIRYRGQDVTDTGIEFRTDEDVEGIDVVVTKRLTTVTGSVTDAQNRPVQDYSVGVFSEDAAHWGIASRYKRVVRAEADGSYKIRGLPPGRYLVIAMADIENDKWEDYEYLERLRGQATPLVLSDAESRTLPLRLVAAIERP